MGFYMGRMRIIVSHFVVFDFYKNVFILLIT